MEVQHPLFAKKLASTLSRRLGIDEPPEEKYSRFLSEDFIIKIASVFETYSGDKLRDENTESKAYIPIRLVKNGDKTIRIKFLSNPTTVEAFDEDKWLKKIEQMNDFLFKDKVCESPVGLAIGVQNCLFDGKCIYVGLRMKAKSNTNFLSSSNGEFDTGYTVLRPPNKLSEVCFKENFNLYKPSANQFVTKEGCPDIFNLMSERLMTLGTKPWPIKLTNGTQEYIATIFVNNSRLLPRFEIGIWKYIDISHIATEPDKKFIEQDFAEVNDLEYWIWVKDGEICYWSFSDEKHIPRHISPVHKEEKKSVLLNTAYLKDTYGRLEKYTPFVSDEDLINSSIDMVNGRFSASASALLTCF